MIIIIIIITVRIKKKFIFKSELNLERLSQFYEYMEGKSRFFFFLPNIVGEKIVQFVLF